MSAGKKDTAWTVRKADSMLKNLLGSLELEVMKVMWEVREATVQQVTDSIKRRRLIAEPTCMTVMVHLVDKGLLTRTKQGKKYSYLTAKSRQKFLHEAARSMARNMIDDLGDIAIAGFLGEIGKIEPDRLEKLKALFQEISAADNASE